MATTLKEALTKAARGWLRERLIELLEEEPARMSESDRPSKTPEEAVERLRRVMGS